MTISFDPQQKMYIEYVISEPRLYVKVRGVFNKTYFERPLQPVVEFIDQYYQQYYSTPTPDIILAKTGHQFERKDVRDDQQAFIINEIEKFSREQAMKLAMYDSMDDLKAGNMTPIVARCQQALLVSIDKDLGTDLFSDPVARLSKMEIDIDKRPCGWASLDIIIDYLKRGELFLFAGGSGAGKSVFLTNIARNMAEQGMSGVYFSFELKEALVASRMDAIFTGIPTKQIFDVKEEVAEVHSTLAQSYGRVTVKKMRHGTTAMELRTFLIEYQLHHGKRPDWVCVDYLDLMGCDARGIDASNAFDRDKAISEELRAVFEEFNVYGFTASQLNREAENAKEKNHSHIAGGKSKINTADVVIAICRTAEQIDRGEVELQALKLRNNKMTTKPIILYWNDNNLRIATQPTIARVVKLKDKVTGAVGDVNAQPSSDIDALRNIVNMSNRIAA